jgi:hypothetical protein
MLESDDIHLSRCYTHHDRPSGRASYSIAISNVGRDKSFVDDLDMERGIVSMRVGFVLRSAEIQPLVPAICDRADSRPFLPLYTESKVRCLATPFLSTLSLHYPFTPIN